MSTIISDAGFQFANGDTQAYPMVPVRQTVLSGTVDTSGFSSFGGSTGSATVTTSTTLVATAANGVSNRTGSIVNPTFTGLSTNGTMYGYMDVNTDGTCTTGTGTLAPIYQWGGTPSVTSGQFTFNIQEMKGYVGNGSTAVQTYRVYVGEFTVAASVVSAIVWYALMARYVSATTNTLPAINTQTSFNHNLGVIPKKTNLVITCITAQAGYVAGEQVGEVSAVDTVGASYSYSQLRATRNAMSVSTPDNQAFRVNPAAGGIGVVLTAANFSYRVEAERGW